MGARRDGVITRPAEPSRALANSLPPSTHKLLAQAGILELVDRVGYRTLRQHGVVGGRARGRSSPSPRTAQRGGPRIDRATLDPLLLEAAADAGVHVERDARVHGVLFGGERAVVSYGPSGAPRTCAARMVLDCSGAVPAP